MSYFNEHKVSKNSQQMVQLRRERKQTDKLDNEKVVAKIHTFFLHSLIQCFVQSRTAKVSKQNHAAYFYYTEII